MADGEVTPALPERTRLGHQLADELRGLVAALATHDVGEEDLRAALDGLRRVQGHLRGPRRLRWYEAEDLLALDETSKDAFHDLSPLRGRLNALAPPLDLEPTTREDGTPVIRATATLGEAFEGPPHGVHGGFVAALFDEVLGAVQSLSAGPGVTGRLTVHYRHLTPLGERLAFEGWIAKEEGKRMLAKATCHAEDGTLCAEAEGLFIKVDFVALQQKMQARREG